MPKELPSPAFTKYQNTKTTPLQTSFTGCNEIQSVLQGATMLMTKRTQGRPPRDSGINGREKLIEATRLYLQSNRKLSLTRSEIAQGCGVTPALISYYFKDKRSLLDAVIKPLIRSYVTTLRSILGSGASTGDRMRDVIHLLIEMSADNAFLVDHMSGALASDNLDAEDQTIFDEFHRSITGLLRDLMANGDWRQADPLLTQVALWGICRAFGEAIRVRDLASPGPETRAELIRAKVDYVCDAFAADFVLRSKPKLCAVS
jgi:AcrR family transcriptional regulator